MLAPIRKDLTEQEIIISNVLSELKLRYEIQVPIGQYIVDFLIMPDIVLEADGIFGHFRKATKKRDGELLDLGIQKVFHIREQKIDDIRQKLKEIFCLE